jgi:pimeloyl-ACP methyl ester carboxylesterase
MQSRAHRDVRDVSGPTEVASSVRYQRPKRRWLRRLGISALVLVAVVAASTAVNLIMETQERSSTTPYGVRVPVAGGHMNVWRNGHRGSTIVLLSGLGTVAPALDFAPLVRQLGDYDVVVVERFGYGYSDMAGPPQGVGNITAEIHEALGKVGVGKPYVLVAHSIAGFYALSYVNQYPDEVSAIIGIDPTVPASKAGAAEPAAAGINWGRILEVAGVARAVFTIAPSLAEPPGGAFTADELERIRRMTIWNYGNEATADETRRIASNATALRGLTLPDALPVLDILSSDSVKTIPGWVQLHEEQLGNVQRHDVVVLDGPHYLYWTKSRAIAQRITGFIAQK